MKTFFLSIGILLAILAVVILNCVYIQITTDKLLSQAKVISQENLQIEPLRKTWDSEKLLISFSTPHRTTDEIEKYIALLEDNPKEVDEYRSLLINAIIEIRKHEEVSVDSIL